MAVQKTWVVLVLGLSLRSQVQTGEIIGGHEAVPHSRPYMVLLELKMWQNKTRYCDGFLVSDEFVMTAAHCQARIYYVHVGLHKFINNRTLKGIEVSRAIPHDDFSNTRGFNDLMLLQLSKKVKFTDHVRPIPLARRSDLLPQRCLVSGWGHSKEKPGMASALREVNVTLANDSSCDEPHAYFSLGIIGPSHGDSGGPLVCENEVAYGVVSRGDKPCHSFHYKVFIKIPDYLAWIEGHLRKK
ncbi:unnamed protein product [Lota lota]